MSVLVLTFSNSQFLISRFLQNELAALRGARDDAAILKGKLVEKQGELELSSRMIDEEIRRETKVKVSAINLFDF